MNFKTKILKSILEEAQFDTSRHKIEVYTKWANFLQAWIDGTLKEVNQDLADCHGIIPIYIDGEDVAFFHLSYSRKLELITTINYMHNLIVDNYFRKIEIGRYELK